MNAVPILALRISLFLLGIVLQPVASFACIGENLNTVHFNSGRPDFGTIPRRMPIFYRGEHDMRPGSDKYSDYDYDNLPIDPTLRYAEQRELKAGKAYPRALTAFADLARRGKWTQAVVAIETYTNHYGWDGSLRDRWQIAKWANGLRRMDAAQRERVAHYLLALDAIEKSNMSGSSAVFSRLYNDPAAGSLRPFALYRLATIALAAGDSGKAQKLYRQAATEFPASPKAEDALIMAVRCNDAVDPDAARRDLRLLLSRYPRTRFRRAAEGLLARVDYVQGNYILAANAYVRLGDVISLEVTLRKLKPAQREKYYPHQLVGYLRMMDAAQTPQKYQWSIFSVDRTLEVLTPAGATAFVKFMVKDPSLAAPYFYYRLYHTRDLSVQYANDDRWWSKAEKHEWKVSVAEAKKRDDGLARLAERIAEHAPDALPPLVSARFAEVVYRQGDNVRAIAWANRVLNAFDKAVPGYDRALFVLGATHHRQGRYTAAIADFRALLDCCPNSAIRSGAREELALLYERTGDLPAALDQYFALDYRQDVAYLLDARMSREAVAAYRRDRPTHPQYDLLTYSLAIRYLREEDLSAARHLLTDLPSHPLTKREEEDGWGISWKLADYPHQARRTINELMELRRQIALAPNREARAATLYREASHLYKSDLLTFYNAPLWGQERAWLFQQHWNPREERFPDAAAVRRHMYRHEAYWRVREKCLAIAERYPDTKAAPRALYRAACALYRLSNLNGWWREENDRAALDRQAARLLKQVYQRYPKDPLARPARKYATVFAGYWREHRSLVAKYLRDDPERPLL